MTIELEKYTDSIGRLPKSGQQIVAFQQDDQVVVYQAYNHQIADYAVRQQKFGGTAYSYSRMSWIKPNFLWMMYRCGWAAKPDQERVLAIWLAKTDFEKILEQAVFSTYNAAVYRDHSHWKNEMAQKEVRLQWDPDHDPHGKKLERRAIQVGMKGEVLENFGKRQVLKIEDMTDFVKSQKVHVDNNKLDELLVPKETIYTIDDTTLSNKIGIIKTIGS